MIRYVNLSRASTVIERQHELTTLRELGCDDGQGYLLSRLVPDSEVAEPIMRDQLPAPARRDTQELEPVAGPG